MNRKGLRLDQAPPLHLPLRFFLTAPLFGVGAGLLLAWKGAELLLTPWSFPTLALVHLITLGFLTMVMMGALYQITPVLVGTPVPGTGLVWLVHLGLVCGLAALTLWLLTGAPFLNWLAVAGLLSAFLTFLGQMALALRRAPTWNATVFSIALAVTTLALAISLGLVFLGEFAALWQLPARRPLATAHVYLALGGWVGTLITGVGYAVIPMFYLSGKFPAHLTWLVMAFQLLLPISGSLVAFLAPSPVWHLIPLLIAASATGVFTFAVVRALRGRKRRIIDSTLRYWQTGIACAPLSLASLAVFTFHPEFRWLMAFGVLFLLGFAMSILSGMLYKIVAFLVWLHRFSKMAGKMDVPLLRDIIPHRPTALQWWTHLLMLGLLVVAALTGHDGLARAGGLALVVSCGALFLILLRAARFNRPTTSTESTGITATNSSGAATAEPQPPSQGSTEA